MAFNDKLSKDIYDITSRVVLGDHKVFIPNADSSSVGTGVEISIGNNLLKSANKKSRKIVSSTPRSTVIIKKKVFSSIRATNDLQWLDKTERMLLRATKALFAYKVSQIRAYESLSKFNSSFEKSNRIDLALFADVMHSASYLGAANVKVASDANLLIKDVLLSSIANIEDFPISSTPERVKNDVLRILKQTSMQSSDRLTTWIVDPEFPDPYGIGPGTGSIELGSYASFNTGASVDSSPSAANLELSDPYNLSLVLSEDIEVAIDEALTGAFGLLSSLSEGANLDSRVSIAAGVELLGLGKYDSTIDVGYIRDRLRTFYQGRTIFGPGDPIYFFCSSEKVQFDYSSDKPVITDEYILDPSIIKARYNLYTNKAISLDDYAKLSSRSQHYEMSCIFAGYITTTERGFSSGQWTVKINCIDNIGWLSWSRFMITPSISDSSGVLEDPLTPFNIKTSASGDIITSNGVDLLSENKELLDSGLLTFDSGIFKGKNARQGNLIQSEYRGLGSLSGAKVIQHPNGFVYRWKKGIITATLEPPNVLNKGINERASLKALQQTYGLTVAEDVLRNIDIANIISILIAGEPYNVESFMEQAYASHSISSKSTDLSEIDPIYSVLDVISRNNNRFGNFKPYRRLTLSENTLKERNSYNNLRSNANKNIKSLTRRLSSLNSIIEGLPLVKGSVSNNILRTTLLTEINTINDSISFYANGVKASSNLDSNGSVVSKFNLVGKKFKNAMASSKDNEYTLNRAMISVGAQRKLSDVKLNIDENFLIISDQYDQNTDIRAFLLAFKQSGFNLFKGQFITVQEKCVAAAKIANFELFCNTQGHIEFRPPQWNRTPVSVLKDLYLMDSSKKKGVVPDFLFDTFQKRTDSLKKEVYNLNARIGLIALLLGKFPDANLIPNFTADNLYKETDRRFASFRFFGIKVDNPKNADQRTTVSLNSNTKIVDSISAGRKLEGKATSKLLSADNTISFKDPINSNTSTLLGVFDSVFRVQSNIQFGGDQEVQTFATPSSLKALRSEFIKITGIDPGRGIGQSDGTFGELDFLFNNTDDNKKHSREEYLIKELERAISSRDSSVVMLNRNREKVKELKEIDGLLSGKSIVQKTFKSDSKTLNKLITAQKSLEIAGAFLEGDPDKGSLFDHLIEDDTRNLLGFGSGRRFIIEDDVIISATFNENAPDYVRVDINGTEALVGDAKNKSFEDRFYWAGATDFDLWRQYGYKVGSAKNLPYASSAEVQCKPFAILELQMQRVKINKASLTIVGNEFYQPGDVVYIKSQGMLYYVFSVSQSVSQGKSFQTVLTLENGHPPGQYLPSPMDIIGQGLTKNSLEDSTIIRKSPDGDDAYKVIRPDGTILFPKFITADSNNGKILSFKDNQSRFTNIMINLAGALSVGKKILIRGFVKIHGDPEVERVKNNLRVMKEMILNPKIVGSENEERWVDRSFKADRGATVGSSVGMSTGGNRKMYDMKFPNGLPVNDISSDQIIEQLVFLTSNEDNSKTLILCSDNQLLNDDILPLGGPKQKSWFDIKISGSDIFDVSSIIEIGILDLNRSN